jgi:TatD DNase family protein
LINEVLSGSVEKICNIGANLSTSKASVELSQKYDNFYASVGVHPSDAVRDMENSDWLKIIEEMYVNNPKVVAIGEIGLDYYWEPFDKIKQAECFIKQIEFAHECKLPISIHSRDATADMLNILKQNKKT